MTTMTTQGRLKGAIHVHARAGSFKGRHGGAGAVRDRSRVMRYDPTGTGAVRRAFVAEVNRRFREYRRLVWRAIVKDDALGLGDGGVRTIEQILKTDFWPHLKANQPHTNQPLPRRVFAFKTKPEKLRAFAAWLEDEADRGILGVVTGPTKGTVRYPAWSDKYITSTFKKGIADGIDKMKRVRVQLPIVPRPGRSAYEAAFLAPVNADAVALMYTRAFDELKGITKQMAQVMSRSLAESLAEGRGPMQTARILMTRMDIPLARARMVARTETIRAYTQASINTYRQAGLEGVEVVAEWSAMEDDKVCEQCQELDGKRMTLEAASKLIPRHPNCRCALLPVVDEGKGFGKVHDEEELADDLGLILNQMHVHGGVGSGNFGHAGRPGEVGGSAEGGGNTIGSVHERFKRTKGTSAEVNSLVVKEKLPKTKITCKSSELPVIEEALAHLASDNSLARELNGKPVLVSDMGKKYGRVGSGGVMVDRATLEKEGAGFVATVVRHELEHILLSRKGVPSGQQESRVRYTTRVWAQLKASTMMKTNPTTARGFLRAANLSH